MHILSLSKSYHAHIVHIFYNPSIRYLTFLVLGFRFGYQGYEISAQLTVYSRGLS